jgi:ATP-dependent Clp protease adaptor protein ClpS
MSRRSRLAGRSQTISEQRGFTRRVKANIMQGRASPSARIDMSDNGKRGEEGPGTGVIVKAKPKTKKPSMYKVLMLNDDYTPMEFVVHILERFFAKSRQEATRIMLHVHRRGVGICGVYTYEVAETKVTQVMDFARQHQHPLQCTLEKD